MFYKIGVKNFVKNVRASFLINIFKKRPQHKCFPVNFVKFFRTPFLQSTSDASEDGKSVSRFMVWY